MNYRHGWLAYALLMILGAPSEGDIFRWDNGQLIPGTEGITLGPGVQMNGRELVLAQMSGKDLSGANFSGANLEAAKLDFCGLTNANFAGANVRGASFVGANGYGLSEQQIYSTASYLARDLRGMVFGKGIALYPLGSNLSGWQLSEQDLTSASFFYTTLTGANLRRARLVDVDFTISTTTNADLTGADFLLANLGNANLSRSDARGAKGLNLTGATVTNLIHPDGRIDGLNLEAEESLVAYPEVAIPVKFGAYFSIAAGAKFDLTDNAAIIDFEGLPPMAAVRQQILRGRSASGLGGMWSGTGITSSTAAAANATQPDSRSLGFALNLTLPLAPYATFRGEPVDASSVLVAYTRTADANLDGIVNDDDVTVVSAVYAPGVPQPNWALGDFDYNGFVDDDDVTLLNAFYDPSAPPLNSLAGPGGGGELNSIVSAIPEPSTALLAVYIVIVAIAARAFGRRWRSLVLVAVAAFTANAATSRGDIFRRDNGQPIPGTEGITLGPGLQLDGRELVRAQLSHADLEGANFAGANLEGATFEFSRLTEANFSGANVRGAWFVGANSPRGLIEQQLYSTASYQAKDLRGITFGAKYGIGYPVGSILSGWDFSGQDLTSAKLSQSNLDGSILRNANLTGVDFENSSIAGADLSGATLYASQLTNVDLSRSNLDGADLRHSFIIDANLAGATMDGSNLTSANVIRTDLRGVRGLNLMGAITSNVIQPDGRIDGLNLKARKSLVASSDVATPVRLAPHFSIDAQAHFDLTDNVVIIDYAGASPGAAVREQILHGRGSTGLGGEWRGSGFRSSTAAAENRTQSDSRSLGYADNAALPLGSYTAFHGAAVDESSILIAYTRTGDANLDGVVNDDDVTIVGATYAPGVSNPHWALGDFDYNGFVDDDDVTLLNAFYDPSAPPLLPQAASGIDGNLSSGTAAVPEPSCLMMALVVLASFAKLHPRFRLRRSTPT